MKSQNYKKRYDTSKSFKIYNHISFYHTSCFTPANFSLKRDLFCRPPFGIAFFFLHASKIFFAHSQIWLFALICYKVFFNKISFKLR